jgi:hypothetical protein
MKNSILKSSLSIILILFTTLAFSQKKETRDVTGFNSVGLSIHADLYLSQGSSYKVEIEASEEDLAKIETIVKDGHLKIKSNQNNARIKDVKIWVTTPDINGIHMSGSGLIMAETPITSDEMEIRISGSGKIKIDELKGGECEVSISGSGDVYLGGTAREVGLRISGSGSIHAADLRVNECDVRLSGSGGCEVDATEELNVSISGSGRVTYYSNPQFDVSISGSGKVRKGDK